MTINKQQNKKRIQNYIQENPTNLNTKEIMENRDDQTSIHSLNSSKIYKKETTIIKKTTKKEKVGIVIKKIPEKIKKGKQKTRRAVEKLMGIQDETLEFRSSAIVLLFLATSLGILLDIFIVFKYVRGNKWYVLLIFFISSLVSFATILIYRITVCFKKIRKYANTLWFMQLSTLSFVFLPANIATTGNLLLTSGVTVFASMIPMIALIVDAHTIGKIYGITGYILLQLMMIHDILTYHPLPQAFKEYALLTASSYVVLFSFGSFTSIILAYYISTLKNQLSIAGLVAEGIARLELTGKKIVELRDAEDKYLSKLEITLKRIIRNVTAYKEYLPETMLTCNFEETEESQESEINSNINSSIASSHHQHSKTTNSHCTGSQKRKWKKGRQFNLGLKKKHISMLMVDIMEFHTLAKQLHPDVLVTLHSSYLEIVNDSIKNNGGVIQGCYGDKIVATWNASRLSLDRATAACNCALSIKRGIDILNKSLTTQKQLSICISITSGESLCGNIGISGLKHFANIGNVVNRLYELIKRNKEYHSTILIDHNTANLMKPLFVYQTADFLTLNADTEASFIYELFKKKQLQSDEWFYELRDLDAQDFLKPFNQAYQCFVAEDYLEATKLVKQFLKQCENIDLSPLYNQRHVDKLKNLLAIT